MRNALNTTLVEFPVIMAVLLIVLLFVLSGRSSSKVTMRPVAGDIYACMACSAHCNNDQTCVASNCKSACSTSLRPRLK